MSTLHAFKSQINMSIKHCLVSRFITHMGDSTHCSFTTHEAFLLYDAFKLQNTLSSYYIKTVDFRSLILDKQRQSRKCLSFKNVVNFVFPKDKLHLSFQQHLYNVYHWENQAGKLIRQKVVC